MNTSEYPIIETYRQFAAVSADDEYAIILNNKACISLQTLLAHIDVAVLEYMGFCTEHMPDIVHLVQIYDALLRRDDEANLICDTTFGVT